MPFGKLCYTPQIHGDTGWCLRSMFQMKVISVNPVPNFWLGDRGLRRGQNDQGHGNDKDFIHKKP